MNAHSYVSHESIVRLFDAARIEYEVLYIRLYIAYNAWYREVTGSIHDREAITQLKRRVIIWDEYISGVALRSLKPLMERLFDLTQRQPLGSTAYWEGVIQSKYDWPSLIEYWYQVRCIVVHGGTLESIYTRLAYESLFLFMQEIIYRVKERVNINAPPSKLSVDSRTRQNVERLLLTMGDIWHADMRRKV